mmetsp:Transcript_29807/g.68661  ORF Transcript_29807/g.68661 Transcript_29807/m.68661 type:complete len:350 (-) Transcript_29807:59-1108(-)
MDDDEEESDSGTAPELRDVVMQLHRACTDMREELLAHRAALEQFLEMRDGMLELLANREAVVGAARVLGEIGDRTAELELSLAGVSDNTARHGRAIANLTDQQKRSASTIDAMVRCVTQLATQTRQRSRSRGTEDSHPGVPSVKTPRRDRLNQGTSSGSHAPFSQLLGHMPPYATSNGQCNPTGKPCFGMEYVETASLDHRLPAQPCHMEACGFGMEGKASKFASDVGHHHHDRVTERPSSRSKPRSARGSGEGPAASQDEMASCVKGVLARIEEALTKLDGNPRLVAEPIEGHEPPRPSRRQPAVPTPRSGAAIQGATPVRDQHDMEQRPCGGAVGAGDRYRHSESWG